MLQAKRCHLLDELTSVRHILNQSYLKTAGAAHLTCETVTFSKTHSHMCSSVHVMPEQIQ